MSNWFLVCLQLLKPEVVIEIASEHTYLSECFTQQTIVEYIDKQQCMCYDARERTTQ